MQTKTDEEERHGNTTTEPTVFYSPSLNTCIGKYTFTNTYSEGRQSFMIYDLLTNENIFTLFASPEDGMSGWDRYEEKIEELKK